MTLEECKNIIKKENLFEYNLFDEHEFRPNEICIRKVKDKYVLFVISERAEPMTNTIKKYDNESEALEKFINRLRAHNERMKNNS